MTRSVSSLTIGTAVLLAGVVVPLAPTLEWGTPSRTGTVRGRVIFDGAPAPDGIIAADAVVYLLGEALVDAEPIGVLPAPTMDQEDYTFSPHVLPIVAGSRITFTNSDPEMHNIHTYTKGPRRRNRTFNRAQRPGSNMSTVFTNPDSIRVLCDIHAQMLAHIFVLPNPFFAKAGDDGTFTIEGVPAGSHELVGWHEEYGPFTMVAEVAAGGTTTVEVDLPALISDQDSPGGLQ